MCPRSLTLVRPFALAFWTHRPRLLLLRPLLTSRSSLRRRPFRHKASSPRVRVALLRCTTAASTPPRLDHESFAVNGPLALLGNAFYAVLVHRLAAALHASFPHSVALMQLRFTSLAVVSSRRDLHPQECAHAGRTKKNPSHKDWGGKPCRCHHAKAPAQGGKAGGSRLATTAQIDISRLALRAKAGFSRQRCMSCWRRRACRVS